MQLKSDSLLQGGKYRIERMLGQGGFGITYLGTQVALNRKVAIKEFFMKEYCNRDSETSHVSVPSEGSKELVSRFRQKFIKEAQTIAEMENNHIIRIHDVFEEHGTAYYVMEYLAGGDLRSRIPKNGMATDEALAYIRQIGDALQAIHSRNILHLDIKPTNIMFRHSGEAVLIDFGISKHYDDEGGGQTSSTPVGVSEGYAPTEQYDREGVSSFSAATDIYSLGATLYCLLNGSRPPKASIVLNEGLPALSDKVPAAIRQAVEKAMAPRRKDRPQNVAEFMALLSGDEEEDDTIVDVVPKPKPEPSPSPQPQPKPAPTPSPWKRWAVPLAVGILAALAVIFWPKGETGGGGKIDPDTPTGTINGRPYVDLGLSVKWADRNVGASSPSDYGSYFAWGETSTKSDYSYSTSVTYEKNFSDIAGNSNYDAARANWGGSWRLPTKAELEELKSKCTWTWTTQGSHNGYKVTGPNGNSIFLPAAGWRSGSSLNYAGDYGYCWSSTPDGSGTQGAYGLLFNSDGHDVGWSRRYSGHTVRPVSE